MCCEIFDESMETVIISCKNSRLKNNNTHVELCEPMKHNNINKVGDVKKKTILTMIDDWGEGTYTCTHSFDDVCVLLNFKLHE